MVAACTWCLRLGRGRGHQGAQRARDRVQRGGCAQPAHMQHPVRQRRGTHVRQQLRHAGGVVQHLRAHGAQQRPKLDDVLQEGLHHGVTQPLHGLEVAAQHAVDEVGGRAVALPHAHRLLQHPRAGQARVVCVHGAQSLRVQRVRRQRLGQRTRQAAQVARQRTKPAERQRRLYAAGVPDLQHAVPARPERRVAVGGEQPEQRALEADVAQAHGLVALQQRPVLVKHRLQRGAPWRCVHVRKHVGGAVGGP
mmetsp:Transcript_25214/g.64033  ORF Transcript_25214/g.64033 Transcript_25214/m.64033 type:complete len:251 (+) Transcript_25214:308-1060(+)